MMIPPSTCRFCTAPFLTVVHVVGYIFTSAWTILLCIAIIAMDRINPLFGWLRIIPAIGVLTGVLEVTGFKAAGAINAISYIFWSVWLIAFGVALLLL